VVAIEGRILRAMRGTLQQFRMVTAFSMALWMAALACVTGCMLPALASPGPKQISCPQEAADPASMDLMSGIANCPHAAHRGPANQHGGKHTPGGRTSCCFLELNVPTRTHAPQPQLMAAHVAIPVLISDVTPLWTHSALEFSPPVNHAGRDTLLQTQLLRI
jgi:hypothetical protein